MRNSTLLFRMEIEMDTMASEWGEVGGGKPMPTEAELEAETIAFMGELFGSPVQRHGRDHNDALVCSVSIPRTKAKRILRKHQLVEGNDQIVAGTYVIVRDFEFRDL